MPLLFKFLVFCSSLVCVFPTQGADDMNGLELVLGLERRNYIKGEEMAAKCALVNRGSTTAQVDRGQWNAPTRYRLSAKSDSTRRWEFGDADIEAKLMVGDERLPPPEPNLVEMGPGSELDFSGDLSVLLPEEIGAGHYDLVALFPHDGDWMESNTVELELVLPHPKSYAGLFDPSENKWASALVQLGSGSVGPDASGGINAPATRLMLREASFKGEIGTEREASPHVLLTGSVLEQAPPELLAKYPIDEAVPAMGETRQHGGRWFLWRSGSSLGAVLWQNGAREVVPPEKAPYDELRLLSPGYASEAKSAWFAVAGRKDRRWLLLGLKAHEKGFGWEGRQPLDDKQPGIYALSFSPRKDKGSFSFLWADGPKVYRQFLNVRKKNSALDPTLVHEAQGEVLALWMPPLVPGRNERPEALILSATETPGEYQLARLNLAKPDNVALRSLPSPPGESERVAMCTLPEGGFALLAQTGDQLHYHFGGDTEAWKLLHRSPGAKFHNIHLALTQFDELRAEWLDDRYGRQWALLPRR